MFELPLQLIAEGEFQFNPITWIPIIAIMVLGYLMIVRPEQQKSAQTQKMHDAIKRNDRVETVGGIVATVASVKKDQQVVVLRLDKAGNEMTVRMRAIAKILDQENGQSDNADD